MTRLFLDDLREPPNSNWAVVRDYHAFVRWIQLNGVPDIISFDHDLADEHYFKLPGKDCSTIEPELKEKTGCDCIRFLLELGQFPKLAILHTWNPDGAKNMASLLADHCEVRHLRYGTYS